MVHLGGGVNYRIHDVLRESEDYRVFDIGSHQSLYLPKFSNGGAALRFIKTQAELVAGGISVIEVKPTGSAIYVIAEKVEPEFSLPEFIAERKEMKKKSRREVEDALVDFAKTTWEYEYISGFRAENLVFDGERWLLLEVGKTLNSIKIGSTEAKGNNLFTTRVVWNERNLDNSYKTDRFVNRKLEERITDAINKVRREKGCGALISKRTARE